VTAPPRPLSLPLPRTVVILGLVSLLNDFASEMVVPLIPLLLATVLGAGPLALGIIEGIADAVSNLLKLWAGRRSDILGNRRKPFVLFGYALSNIVRPLIAVSGHWLAVLGIRVVDRIGKGLRTAPRDALVADAIADGNAGRAFGFMRALDHSGAVIGSLAAAAAVYWGTDRLDIVIALSAIPGVLAVALIAVAVTEPARPAPAIPVATRLAWSRLDAPIRRYLLALALFMLGRIPETFLLLRGYELGIGVVELLLLWAAVHLVKAVTSEYAGRIADRRGRRPMILAGWGIYVATLPALAFAASPAAFWIFALVLGLYFGLSEGAERALVRELAPAAERGTAFGWYHMVAGLAAIPAGMMLGALWSYFGVHTAFLVSAACAAVASIGFAHYVRGS